MKIDPHTAAVLADRAEALAFADLYAAAAPALRSRLGLRVEHMAGATLLLAPGLPVAMFNRVIGLGLQQPVTDADIDAIVAAYRGAGIAPWWLHVNPLAAPADLAARLQARGFSAPPRRSWAKMLRGTEAAAPVDSSLLIVPARDDQVAETAQVVTTTFEMPPFVADWFAALHGRPHWRFYSVLDGAAVVGGGCLFVDGDLGWLGMGAVLPTHRRRGGQAALMARRIADAGAAGARWAVTETGEPIGDEPNPSLANMRRAGFEQVASRLNFAAPA